MIKKVIDIKPIENSFHEWEYFEVEFIIDKKHFIDIGGMVIHTPNGFLVTTSSNTEKLCKTLEKSKKFIIKEYQKRLDNE